MIRKCILRIIITLILFNLASVCAIGDEFVHGTAKLTANLLDGRKVQVVMRTRAITAQFPYKNGFLWGGEFETAHVVIMPKCVITSIDMQVDNENFSIPLSAYSDLGDPDQVMIEPVASGFRLRILGGKYTASGYEAVLEFGKDNIERRKVRLRTFPDQVWEETVYSFIGDNEGR